jgi:hypothetical protein
MFECNKERQQRGNEMYLSTLKPEMQRIFSAAFPGYSGRKWKIETTVVATVPATYWDGGSRTECVFLSMVDLKRLEIAGNHPFFERNNPAQAGATVELTDGVAMVTHSISQGRDMGLTLYVNPANINPELLPAPVELSADETTVLVYTRSLKSSYGGVSDYRRVSSGLSTERWETAKAQLIDRGLLKKNGSITAEGKNAVSGKNI